MSVHGRKLKPVEFTHHGVSYRLTPERRDRVRVYRLHPNGEWRKATQAEARAVVEAWQATLPSTVELEAKRHPWLITWARLLYRVARFFGYRGS